MVLKLYYKQHFLFNLKSMITLCLVLKPATQTCLFLVSLKQITPFLMSMNDGKTWQENKPTFTIPSVDKQTHIFP